MKAGLARAFGLVIGILLTLGCSDGSSAGKAPSGSPVTLASPLDVANGIAGVHSRLDVGNNIELKGDAFTLASVGLQPPAESSFTNAFSASAPRILSKALRLSRNNDTETWLQIRALGVRDTAQGAVEQGSVVFRSAAVDLDVVISFGSSHLEELRVLRSAKAATTARYALEVAPGMLLRALDGRIEALDRAGRVAFRTNAAFAVDSAGAIRSVEMRLDGNELSTSFDSSGLKYPVVVDPEWVTGPTWPREAVLAQNSFELSLGGTVVGDATVIQHSSGTFVGSLAPAQLDSGAQLTGGLSADSIRLQSGSVISGDAHFNTLSGPGLVRGERFPTLALPVPASAPNFPAFTVGTRDITTSGSAPLQLAASNYRNLNLKSGTTLRLIGGVYTFNSIAFGSGSRFECLAACDVRVLGRFIEASGGFFGPAAGASIGADQVEVFVSSANGSSSLTAIPAVALSSGSTIRGRFFAPNGTIIVGNGVQVVGTLVGRDVLLSSGAQVVKDNPTPTCAANDNNPCTQDSCNAAGQPIFTPRPAGSSCADGNVCNGVEVCNGIGVCAPGTPLAADDGNPCTTDSCDPTTGLLHAPVASGTLCSDGNVCNGTELCDGAGKCAAGATPVVDDDNPCTADFCDPTSGVTHTPTAPGTSCSDSNACNGDETCNALGFCIAGTPPVVDDGNPCTTDQCDPALGVLHTPTTDGTTCDDGNGCTQYDSCLGGTCHAGSLVTCTATDPCHSAGTCDPKTGSCSNPSLAAGSACVSALVGPDGGIVRIPGVGQLSIPEGALTLATNLSMVQIPPPLASGGEIVLTTAAVALGPEGLRFQKPATLSLIYTQRLLPGPAEDQKIYQFTDGSLLSADGGAQTTTDTAARSLSLPLTHFSNYVGGSAPTPIFPKAIAAGAAHACLLLNNGGVECWGANYSGQLGIGTSAPAAYSSSPLSIQQSGPYVGNATAIAAGSDSTCAVLGASGGVACWGLLANSPSPTAVPNTGLATAVAVGGDHACALLSDGSVSCWGQNELGQLGSGTTSGPDPCPDGSLACSRAAVPVSGLTGVVTALAAGYSHTCALLWNDTIVCWGDNGAQQLGQQVATTCGATAEPCSTVPIPVSGVNSLVSTAALPTSIAAGSYFTCAVMSEPLANTLECWGNDSSGELGSGQIGFNQGPLGPVAVVNSGPTGSGSLLDVVGVAASTLNNPFNPAIPSDPNAQSNDSGDGACALLVDGTVACWGSDQYGQLGNAPAGCNEQDCSDVPVSVADTGSVTAIAVGGSFACALSPPVIQCWGNDAHGELGDGRTSIIPQGPRQVLPTIARIDVTPATPVMATGQNQQFVATAIFTDSSTRDVTNNSVWSSSDPTILSLSPTGAGAALTIGTTTVRVDDPASGVLGVTQVQVSATPPCAGLTVGAVCGTITDPCGDQTVCDSSGACALPPVTEARAAQVQNCIDQCALALSSDETDPTIGMTSDQLSSATNALYDCLGLDVSCAPRPPVPGNMDCETADQEKICEKQAYDGFNLMKGECADEAKEGAVGASGSCMALNAAQLYLKLRLCRSALCPTSPDPQDPTKTIQAQCITCTPNNLGIAYQGCLFLPNGICATCEPVADAPGINTPALGPCLVAPPSGCLTASGPDGLGQGTINSNGPCICDTDCKSGLCDITTCR